MWQKVGNMGDGYVIRSNGGLYWRGYDLRGNYNNWTKIKDNATKFKTSREASDCFEKYFNCEYDVVQ